MSRMIIGLSGVPAITFSVFLFILVTPILGRWSERTPQSDRYSASCSGSRTHPHTSEDVSAHTVELAEHAALEQSPESLNRVCVDVADNVPVLMLDDGMRKNPGHSQIACIFIGNQAGLPCVYPIFDKGP